MHCNQCGLEVPDNYKFCPKCGAEITPYSKNNEQTNEIKKPYQEQILPSKVRTGKKGAIIGGIFAILALIFTIAFFVNGYHIAQENVDQANQNLAQANADLDAVVNKAIVHCQQNAGDACNIIMKQWYDKCQENDMKDIPSCHDGRIETYLKNVGLSYSTEPTQSNLPQTNADTITNENQTVEACVATPSETCNYQLAILYKEWCTTTIQLNQCNPKVVLYFIKNAILIDSSGNAIIYQGAPGNIRDISGPQFSSSPGSSYSNEAYFKENPSQDPRQLYHEVNPSYAHPDWDFNTASLNVLAFCQQSSGPPCDMAITTLSGLCYDRLVAACSDERLADYLVKRNLADQVIRQ